MRTCSITRKSLIIFGIVLLLFAFPRCIEEESTVPLGQGWTGDDPTSIPFRQRLLLSERGNLVHNPSFEQGRLVNLNNNTINYNITGWKGTGENVIWYIGQADSSDFGNEVHTGTHSIKIHRDDHSGSQGSAIVSDFIRVIPGNYSFSFWTRLEDIRHGKERTGKRLNDAIDIKVLFFDKNRLLITGTDQSPRPIPFSNFWSIDSLGWTSLEARTSNDYLTEGDIPDEAKYVKLYIGMRGTGTMWIDDVEFRYTRRNFTALERSEHLFDTNFSPAGMLIPTPQKITELEPLTYFKPGSEELPVPLILIPEDHGIQTAAAANLLKSKLDSLFSGQLGKGSIPEVKILYSALGGEVLRGGLVFRFSKAKLVEEEYRDRMQAYSIKPDSVYPNLVLINGNSSYADYYAATTAAQLLGDSGFVYHQAEIYDYPDIALRAFLVSPVAAATNSLDYSPYLSQMTRLKFNWAYLDYYRSRTLWKQESSAYSEGLRIFADEAGLEGMLKFSQMVNPYAYLHKHSKLDSLSREEKQRWSHASISSQNQLKRMLTEGLRAGASSLVICTQDYLPLDARGAYTLYSDQDREKYINLQEAHLETLRSLYTWISSRYPETRLEFIPPWYSNESIDMSRGQAEQYFNDLDTKLPDNLHIFWSGPSSKGNSVNRVEFIRLRSVTDKRMVFFNNSMNSLRDILYDTSSVWDLPLKIRTLSLFEPMDFSIMPPIRAFGRGKMLINSPPDSEIMKIRLATAADYMWNIQDYDPDFSLWKALVCRYGTEFAKEIYRFNDAYFAAQTSIVGIRTAADRQRLVRQVNTQLNNMEESLSLMDALRGNEDPLVNELKSLKQSLEGLYDKTLEIVATQIIATYRSM